MSHYFREANKCVDALTRKGSAMDQDIVYFDSRLWTCVCYYFMIIWVCTMRDLVL